MPSLENGEKYQATTITNQYGIMVIDEEGNYSFTLNNDSPFVDGLNTGDTVSTHFPFESANTNGTITVHIEGTTDNREPITTIQLQEDVITTATGTLNTAENIYDPVTYVEGETVGTYGTFYLSESGAYYYVLDNDAAHVQALAEGQKVSETFSYTYTTSGGQTETKEIIVEILGSNDAPIATVETNTIGENEDSMSGNIYAYDIDNQDSITITLESDKTSDYGSLRLHPDGNYTYFIDRDSPLVQGLAEGETYVDVFIYTVTDKYGATTTNRLEITIEGKNDTTQINPVVKNSLVEDSDMVAVGKLPLPYDPDTKDAITFVPTDKEECTYGSIFITAGGSYIYTLDNENPTIQALGQGEQLTETIQYTTIDSAGKEQTHSLEITIHGTNDEPFIAKQDAKIDADSAHVTGQIIVSDADINDILSFSSTSATGAYGRLELAEDGSYKYILNNEDANVRALAQGDRLVEIFEIIVTDKEGASSTNYFEIVIEGTNDAPEIIPHENIIEEGTTHIRGELARPSDIDTHDSAEYIPQTIVTKYGEISIGADGRYEYTLNNEHPDVIALKENESLQDIIPIYAQDTHGAISESTLTITIEGADDIKDSRSSASMSNTSSSGDEVFALYLDTNSGDITQIAGTLNAIDDIDSAKTSYIPQNDEESLYGTFSLSADGQYTYIIDNKNSTITNLAIGEKIQDSIIIEAIDEEGLITKSTFTMNIEGSAEYPSGYLADNVISDFFENAKESTNANEYSMIVDYTSTNEALDNETAIQSEILKMG